MMRADKSISSNRPITERGDRDTHTPTHTHRERERCFISLCIKLGERLWMRLAVRCVPCEYVELELGQPATPRRITDDRESN